jgi:putative membrane protein
MIKERLTAFRSEWKHLATHRMLIISLIVILFIPIMYGGFFLGSIWDPYGNTKHLPVAVVNEDKGAELHGTHVNVGADLVTNLKDNHDMGWQFVSSDQADKGIQDGTYYMKVVVPSDFSAHAASVTSATPQQSVLQYTLTPSRNYVASLLTKEAATQIQQTVASNVTDAYVSALLQSVSTLGDGLTVAANGAAQLASGSATLQSGLADYTSGVASLTTGQTSLSSGLSSLSSGIASLRQGSSQLAAGLPTASQLNQMSSGVTQIQQGLAALNTAVSTTNPTLAQQQQAVMNDVTALHQALINYQSALTADSSSIYTLTTLANSGQTTVSVNTSDLQATLAIITDSQTVASDAVSLLTNLSALDQTLAAQQTSLQSSVGSLSSGMNTLTPNLQAAIGGYSVVVQGNQQLFDGLTTAYGGALTAKEGSTQLLDGTKTLDDSSTALLGGAAQLTTGSEKLSLSLSDASAQVSLQPTGELTKDQIVTPVKVDETIRGDVPNYGYALSPYVLSLGLYVGALVFNVIYPIRRFFEKPRSARAWWFAKASVAATVAVSQALVLGAIMVFGLGLHPDHPGQFVLLTIVTSLTYMSIITSLTIAFDNIGRFFAMLLLVLQLGAAGGVFPILLSSSFFQAANPFMPMTYSIYAFREAISSGLGAHVFWANIAVLIAIGLAANLLLILFLRIHGMRHFKHEAIEA